MIVSGVSKPFIAILINFRSHCWWQKHKSVNPKLEDRNPKQMRMTQLKNSNLGFRICFEIRYSYFEFMERFWNDFSVQVEACRAS